MTTWTSKADLLVYLVKDVVPDGLLNLVPADSRRLVVMLPTGASSSRVANYSAQAKAQGLLAVKVCPVTKGDFCRLLREAYKKRSPLTAKMAEAT